MSVVYKNTVWERIEPYYMTEYNLRRGGGGGGCPEKKALGRKGCFVASGITATVIAVETDAVRGAGYKRSLWGD